jgi:hypothetical protein
MNYLKVSFYYHIVFGFIMSDIESDTENKQLSTTQASNATSLTHSNSIKEECYRHDS